MKKDTEIVKQKLGKANLNVIEFNEFITSIKAFDFYRPMFDKMYRDGGYNFEYDKDEDPNKSWPRSYHNIGVHKDMYEISKLAEELEAIITIDILAEEELYYTCNMNKVKDVIIPKEYLKNIVIFSTFDDQSIESVLALKDGSDVLQNNPLAAVGGQTKNELLDKKEKMRQMKVAMEEEIKEKQVALRLEMDLKLNEFKVVLEGKRRNLLNQMEPLKDEIFLMETQYYSIISFLGETVEFKQLIDGKKAGEYEPISLYQKIRYLDEELGKMIHIYNLDWSDMGDFEKMLIHSEQSRTYFVPDEKCMTVVRLSRSGVRYHYEEKGDSQYSVLKKTELMHGTRIGILIRNGESLYMGWTDDDMIGLNDDNLFYTNKTHTDVAVDLKKKEEYDLSEYDFESHGYKMERNNETFIENKEKQRKNMFFPFSRIHIKAMIEGILKRGDMIDIPETESIKQAVAGMSMYLHFKSSDLQVEDNRFGSLDDMLELIVSQPVRVKDDILTYTSISTYGQKGRDRSHSDWKIMTYDASVSDNTIYQINLVEENQRYNSSNMEYFVSCEKTYSDKGARANVKIYSDEFINLTYFNSEWVKYLLMKEIPFIDKYAKNFVQIIPYMTKAIYFLEAREEVEKKLIEKELRSELESDWQDLLSRWKLDKKVRKITEFQARRFAKYLLKKGVN